MMSTSSLFISCIEVGKRVKHHQNYQKVPKRSRTVCGVCLKWASEVKRTETCRTNGDKFQLLLSYIKPHVEVHSSTFSKWIKEILKETGVDANVFKRSLYTFSLCLKSMSIRNFSGWIYLVEGHGQMNLPGKNSIINKCFQRSNFFRKGY